MNPMILPCYKLPDARKDRVLSRLLKDYLIYRHMSVGAEKWYRRAVNVFCTWAGKPDIPLEEFNEDSVSQFLLAKEQEGRKAAYLRSLHNGLLALLRFLRGGLGVRPVRRIIVDRPTPHAWTGEEVQRLMAACDHLEDHERLPVLLVIGMGYFTGLDFCDIQRLEQQDIGSDGVITVRRRKTGNLVVVKIPPAMVTTIRQKCPHRGPCLKLPYSHERFRQRFRLLTTLANIIGTFKTLRKTSGSAVEKASPGTGHRHLGNSRTVFERHYEALLITRSSATMAPEVQLPAEVEQEIDPSLAWI